MAIYKCILVAVVVLLEPMSMKLQAS